jgi:molybdopterin-guanine dinucleotide biosynthesis protein A
VGALEAARGERVLVVATDLPLVTSELLEGLVAASDADAVVPREALPQPLCAVYRRRPALAAAVANLAAGRLALRALLEVLDVRYVEGEALRALDPDGHALMNLNTPEDLTLAEAWLSERRACPADALPRE